VKLSGHEDLWENGGIAPRILNLGTRWRSVVNLTTRSLYFRGKSPQHALDRRVGGPVPCPCRESNIQSSIS